MRIHADLIVVGPIHGVPFHERAMLTPRTGAIEWLDLRLLGEVDLPNRIGSGSRHNAASKPLSGG